MKSYEIGSKRTQIFFMHGLRGYGCSQRAALQHLSKRLGVTMVSLEMPGHGEEAKARHCLVPPYQVVVEDICEEIMRHSMETEQVILMGYSFGATLMLLAAQALQQNENFTPKVAGFVGVSSAFSVGHNVPAWQLALSKAIAPVSRYSFEKSWRLSRYFTIHEMDVTKISNDPTVRAAIESDPLIYKGRIPLATSAQVYRCGVAAGKALKGSSLDTLLLHSTDDSIALAPTPGEYGAHVKLRLYDNLQHNCIDGISREVIDARRQIVDFVSERR